MKSMHSFAALLALIVGSACSSPLPPSPVNDSSSVVERSTQFLLGTKASTKPFWGPRTRLAARQTQTTQHASHTLSLHVLLLDTTELLDDQTREAFELAVLNFVAKGSDQIEDLSVESFSDVTVVDQKLTWSRLVDGQSATGIEVHFDAKATVSKDVEQKDLESTLQSLFDDNSRAFRRAFNLALRGEPPAGEEEPDSVIETLKPMQVPLGLSAIAAGCIGLVAIMFACTRNANKADGEETKEMSKTSIVEVNDTAAQEKEAYPVQQATTSRRVAYDDSSDSSAEDVLTFDDNSFNASLVFCPSVEKAQQDVRAMFDCGESAIANLDDATDSEGGDTLERSPIPSAQQKPLTSDALSAFDDDVRRAEC